MFIVSFSHILFKVCGYTDTMALFAAANKPNPTSGPTSGKPDRHQRAV
jgi:hypothetical protein